MIKLSIPLFLLILLSFEYANAQPAKNQFVLNGKIVGVENGTIYLSHYDEDLKTGKTDSSLIKNGLFSFSGKVNGPTVAFIKLNKREAFGTNATNIFLEPTSMNVSLIHNNFTDAHLTGSKTQTEYQKIIIEQNVIRQNNINLINKLEKATYAERNVLNELLSPAYDSMNKVEYRYFSENPTSYLTGYLLQYHERRLSDDSLAMFYNRLGDDIKKYPFAERVYEKIKIKEIGSIGSKAAKFLAKDTSNNEFYSGFIKEKYILLDFWASWCVPCRQNSPHLIELYKKYKDKGLRIVGIADDRDLTKWKDAIKKDSTFLWTQVLRGANPELKMKGLKDVGDINEKFGVHTLPTYILIDPYGVIIGRYGEDIAELSKQLANIFK
ncbi:MAG: TlpA disulfide reductase family protein [Chitinophagaceae bacterium]